jgi:peroxiredoxin
VTALQDQLDEITANTRRLVQAERMAINERAVRELFESGIEEKILPVGAMAPEFTLNDASGRPVRSADLLALGPLVLNFFRGRWCPYCITELETWRDLYPEIRARGALVVGISPQTLRQNDFAVQQHKFNFPLLRDAGCQLAEKLGLVWTLPPYYRDYLRSILVNIPFINSDLGSRTTGYRPGHGGLEGPDSNSDEVWRMPIPATFVVRQDGEIVFAEGHADFRVRPEPLDVLNLL